jgi:hypothetical protein
MVSICRCRKVGFAEVGRESVLLESGDCSLKRILKQQNGITASEVLLYDRTKWHVELKQKQTSARASKREARDAPQVES